MSELFFFGAIALLTIALTARLLDRLLDFEGLSASSESDLWSG
jgi:hypothetical protein